jgi:hypothetical protein
MLAAPARQPSPGLDLSTVHAVGWRVEDAIARSGESRGGGDGRLRHRVAWTIVVAVVALAGMEAAAPSEPEGHLTIAFDTSIALTSLDLAETLGTATPFPPSGFRSQQEG